MERVGAGRRRERDRRACKLKLEGANRMEGVEEKGGAPSRSWRNKGAGRRGWSEARSNWRNGGQDGAVRRVGSTGSESGSRELREGERSGAGAESCEVSWRNKSWEREP